MQYKPLGQSGIDASIIGIGTWVAGQGANDDHYIRAIHAALDEGVSLIDTAPSYGWGHSEEVVGKAIKDRRERAVVATKCGVWWEDVRGSFAGVKDGRDTYICLRPDTIVVEVENSLRRLGIEFIDLLQVHKPAIEPENTPIVETMGCLMELRNQGKVRAIGVSNVSVEQLDTYRSVGELASNQFRYSMIYRDPEADMLPHCAANDIATLTYMSLEQGLLTGKINTDRVFAADDFRNDAGQWLPWFKPANRDRLLDLFADWSDLTEQYSCSIAQLVIAWTAAQRGATHVLCGVRTIQQAHENAAAGALRLEESDVARMRQSLLALGDPM